MNVLLLRDDALMVCTHELGRVSLVASQQWVRVQGHALLVADDPEGRPIAGCPNLTVVTKPCTSTLRVATGYSDLIFVDGHPMCLDTVSGSTDGQGGAYRYKVNDPAQDLVAEGRHG